MSHKIPKSHSLTISDLRKLEKKEKQTSCQRRTTSVRMVMEGIYIIRKVEIIVLNRPFFNTIQQNPSHTNDISLFDFILRFLGYLAEKNNLIDTNTNKLTLVRPKGVKIRRRKIEITDIFIYIYQ